MKRRFFIVLFVLFLTSCASVSRDSKPFGVRCDVSLEPDCVTVTAEYYGADWEFVYGVDFKNARGEERHLKFKEPRRRVLQNGNVSEFGVTVIVVQVEKWREFFDGGEVLAKVRASHGSHEYEPAHVWRKD